MRKSTLLAAAAAFSVSMFASDQVMAGKIKHHVSGGGMNTIDLAADFQSEWTYGFTALEDVDGNVKGQAQFSRLDDSTIKIHVAITCLNVDDYYPAAIISGMVVETNLPDDIPVGTAVGFAVEDNGGFDRITRVQAAADNNPQACDEAAPKRILDLLADLEEWINGNVTVR